MIRSIFQRSISKRVWQFAISKPNERTHHPHCAVIYAYTDLLRPQPTTLSTLNTRAMSSGDSKDLGFNDIKQLAKEKLEKKVVLIDVREPDEIKETGLIPGFIHIPLAEVPSALKASAEKFKEQYGIEKPGQDSMLVFSCRSGKRSQMALKEAIKEGYHKSKHYAGGWMDWADKSKK